MLKNLEADSEKIPVFHTTKGDVDTAVKLAREASIEWSNLSFKERAKHILAVRDMMVEQLDRIVDVIVEETGKVRTEAIVNEALVVSELISYYAKAGEKALAPERVSAGLLFNKAAEIHYEPIGVVGVISPWNYPLTLSMGPLVTALFAGNTVVLKPSEITPKTGLEVVRLFKEIGPYPDIVQGVVGRGDVGQMLVKSDVDMIAFTGSVRSGIAVMTEAAKDLKPVLLELGGKDPMIVLEDANIERAARGAVWGAFTNCGQTCMAVERVYVHEKIFDKFVEKTVDLTKKIRQGQDDKSDIGSMTHPNQLSIVRHHLEDALNHGAKLLCGGEIRSDLSKPAMTPAVLVNVNHSMKVMKEETFGPLLPIMPFSSEEEAIKLANDSDYGLNASVWSRDKTRAKKVAAKLESGNVCINDVMVSYAIGSLPFGGVKYSGIGRTHGYIGLREMTKTKSIAIDKFGFKTEIQWLPLKPAARKLAYLIMGLRAKNSKTLKRFFKS
jgi:acyl-CoA reductase-like NAD-dependent aldehyde dehydrogenase